MKHFETAADDRHDSWNTAVGQFRKLGLTTGVRLHSQECKFHVIIFLKELKSLLHGVMKNISTEFEDGDLYTQVLKIQILWKQGLTKETKITD